MEKINLDEVPPFLDQDPPAHKPRKEKKPVAEKTRRNRRKDSELAELVAKAEELIVHGMTKTKACEEVGIGLSTYKRLSEETEGEGEWSSGDDIGELISTFKSTKSKLEKLGVQVSGGEITLKF